MGKQLIGNCMHCYKLNKYCIVPVNLLFSVLGGCPPLPIRFIWLSYLEMSAKYLREYNGYIN